VSERSDGVGITLPGGGPAALRFCLVVVLAAAGLSGPASAIDPMENAAAMSRHAGSYAALQAVEARLLAEARTQPDSYPAQLEPAEMLLSFANRLRNERKIRSGLSDDLDGEYRSQQAEWAEQALPLAERAVELARDDAERAQAERVLGELYAHRITGMISGMINGPRARRHIGRALELAPEDPECNRAIGLMYLHNPPISGGDVPKAIETFARCAEQIPDERCYVLLAMAYRKHGDLVSAREAVVAALARDKDSIDAKLLLAELR
jgi:tetratricopeptide (TPR) repeat protein